MCGYIGQVSFNKINNNLIEKCNENIICRGPDEKIVYTNKNTKLFLFSNPIKNQSCQ